MFHDFLAGKSPYSFVRATARWRQKWRRIACAQKLISSAASTCWDLPAT